MHILNFNVQSERKIAQKLHQVTGPPMVSEGGLFWPDIRFMPKPDCSPLQTTGTK